MINKKHFPRLLIAGCVALVGCDESNAPAVDSGGFSAVPADSGSLPTAPADSGSASSDATVPDTGMQAAPKQACETFESTFSAIQSRIFERHGCTAAKCHGGENTGMLDLRPGVAYAGLVEAASSNSSFRRVEPGAPSRSFLYLKLLAATRPDRVPVGVQIGGSPMPIGMPPVSEDELEAIRIWITQGAPEKGSVGDPAVLKGSVDYVNELLSVCLPPAAPADIPPLPVPPADKGVQIAMPPYLIDGEDEKEICFASYYDLTDRVPARFKSADNKFVYVNGRTLRQDAVSHHLVVINTPELQPEDVRDPAFGTWTCKSGARDAQPCDPLDLTSCGDGICSSEAKPSTNCTGYGPSEGAPAPVGVSGGLATTLQTQVDLKALDGVYKEVPIKGILYWNAHAFNLTRTAHKTRAWLNLNFTDDLRYREERVPGGYIGPTGIAPFTKKDLCGTQTLPQGTKMLRMTSHTHKHGEYFWVTDGLGKKIYEAFKYSDPTLAIFDPPMQFDAPDEAQRTLRFCATFNNGVDERGFPDADLVARRSRFPMQEGRPLSAACAPIACVSGKVGALCAGTEDSAACDSSPGAGDGQCDACATLAGDTTEHEMFFMLPDVVLPPGQDASSVRGSVDPVGGSGTTGGSGTVQCGNKMCSGATLMGTPVPPCCPANAADACGVSVFGSACLSQEPGTPDPSCPSQSAMGGTLAGCCMASHVCGVDLSSLSFLGISGCNDPAALAGFAAMSGMAAPPAGPPHACGQ